VARPKKSAPRPDTVLVTFRLAQSLVAALDDLAQGRGSTRSDVARTLMQQGLAGLTAAAG
jgi:predicted transcriptional regulator